MKTPLNVPHQHDSNFATSQVVELELAKDYALRVKDMAAAEQASTAATAHAAEVRAQKQMLFDLRQETDVLLGERDKQLQQNREKHQVDSEGHPVFRCPSCMTSVCVRAVASSEGGGFADNAACSGVTAQKDV